MCCENGLKSICTCLYLPSLFSHCKTRPMCTIFPYSCLEEAIRREPGSRRRESRDKERKTPLEEKKGHHLPGTHIVKFSSMKQRLRSSPAHSCTPMMPKMKKTKKQRRRTFPSMGSVSRSSVTRMRIPEGRTKRSPKKENLH